MKPHFDTGQKNNKEAENFDLLQQVRYFAQLPILKKFIEAIPIPVMVLNTHRQVVFSNQALVSITGKNSKEIIFGMLPGEIFDCVHADEPGVCGTTEFCTTCGALHSILSSKIGSDVQECRIIKEDNEALDLKVYSSPLMVGKDKLTLFAVTDISNEKRRKNLERIFFHDLLNTASSVKALAYSLENANESDSEEFRSHLVKLSDKLVDEICAQRDIYAAENNELKIFLSRCNSFELMEDVCEQFNLYPGGKNIIIEKGSENMDFFTDKVLIRRILSNMMKNAVEATEDNKPVKIGCKRNKDFIEFSIRNPGYMEKEVQLQIFQRSFTTKGFDRGIGTYSMKLLCENYLMGKISFTSSKEEGTTFYCSIPVNLE